MHALLPSLVFSRLFISNLLLNKANEEIDGRKDFFFICFLDGTHNTLFNPIIFLKNLTDVSLFPAGEGLRRAVHTI